MLQEYLDQLFDAFKEGICISDVEGTVVHLNRRHAEITGIPREEMLGHSVMEFVRRGRLDVVLNPEVMRTGQPATRVQTVSDGRKLILEANPVFDAQGKLVLCITFLRDVTMLSEMREQISVQKELLEAFQQLSTAGDAQELSRKTPKLFTSSAMIKLYGEVNTIAETDATVLLLGETGVGKDVIARRIHALSLRKNKTFIKVDCGSIPENLIETELFGYAAGTFSGASKTGEIGLIEAAAGGTLFLDGVEALPLTAQMGIVRLLRGGETARVGGGQGRTVNVRLIAGAGPGLSEAVREGLFLKELHELLREYTITVPPLRERRSDIEALAARCASRFAQALGKQPKPIAPEAMEALLRYSWPGNVRELETVLERAVALAEGDVIGLSDLHARISAAEVSVPTGKPLPGHEAKRLLAALERTAGNVREAAKLLGISRGGFYVKLKKLGLNPDEYR